MDPRHLTLPAMLSEHYTAWFGKLDVLRDTPFHENFLTENWSQLYPEAMAEFDGVMASPTWTGKYRLPRSVHHEDVITQEACYFLERCPGPWCVGVGFYGPHPPYAAPEPFGDLYDPRTVNVPPGAVSGRSRANGGHPMGRSEWAELIAQYLGQLTWIDECLGRIMVTLKARGDWDNTIVVFTSDHGDILGDHGLFSKGVYAYEGNARVPLVVRAPWLSPSRYDHVAQLIDLVPTLLEWSGTPIPAGVQGRSLAGALASGARVNDVAVSMIGHRPRLRMVRDDRYKYWLVGSQEALFDLEADPLELNRLWDGAALSEMRLKLASALIDAEDREPIP